MNHRQSFHNHGMNESANLYFQIEWSVHIWRAVWSQNSIGGPFNTWSKDTDTHFGPPTSDDNGDSLGPGLGGVLVQVHVLHAPHHLHPPHHVVAEALELAVLVPVPVEHSAALAVHLLLGEPQPEGGHLIYSASTSLYHQNIPIFVSLHLHFSKPLSW